MAARSAGPARRSVRRYLPRLAPWLLPLLAREPARPRAREHRSAGGDDGPVRRRNAADARRRPAPATCCAATASCISTRARPSCARRNPDGRRAPTTASRSRTCTVREAIAELQPGLSPALVAATFVPGWKTVSDPLAADRSAGARSSSSRAAASGAPTRRRSRPAPTASRVQLRDGGPTRRAARRRRRRRVVAPPRAHAGRATFRSRPSAATTRRCPSGAFDLKRQLTFGGHGFVVTPLACGVRVGGAVEFAGLDAPPNFARADDAAREGQALHARAAHRRRQRVDGLSPVAARFAARDRPGRRGRARRLRVRPRPPGPHAGRRDGAPRRRHHVAGAPPPLDLAPFRPQRFDSRTHHRITREDT